jgi:cobyrinic acid a,c-diamide synthase
MNCPRVIVAGTGSGVGKTSVALALVSALKRRGWKVQPFKVGPDYLDPTYLSVAAGRPCYNLDSWMCGKDYVKRLFNEKARTADMAVIEGVMGLFDGSDPIGPDGSTGEIAALLDAPVLLVVNVHGMARSAAAVVKGYVEFQPDVKIRGIVANQCGSERHGEWLNESFQAFGLPPKIAAIPSNAFPELPHRHLGLTTADASIMSERALAELVAALETHGSIDSIVEIARNAPPIPDEPVREQIGRTGRPIRLGIARDSAFHFYYPDNLEALSACGCQLVEFSPIQDETLPESLDCLYIGGGYPEEHAAELSRNKSMLNAIREFAASRRAIYAECGGLMYLSQGIEATDGRRFEMAGLLPHWTRMLERLKSLGYVEVELTRDSLFGGVGTILRGHEFHYSELLRDPVGDGQWCTAYLTKRRLSGTMVPEGFQRGRVLASYVHAHFASHLGLVQHFVSTCRAAARDAESRSQ